MSRAAPTSIKGVGIGLRRPHFETILQTDRKIGWLEMIPENFVQRGGMWAQTLTACRERWPILAHGVSQSLGGPDPFDADYLAHLRRLLDDLNAPFYSDHLCFVNAGGISSFDLLPLPFHDDAVMHVARRIRELQERLQRPVAVENISYYAVMPGSCLREGEFVRAVVEEADCGLLLDVNNVYVNAINHGLDPLESLGALPLERTWQIHIAGHTQEGGRLLDHHGAPVVDGVWSLLGQAVRLCGDVPVLLEWDTNIPELDRVLDEADRADGIIRDALDSSSVQECVG